MRAYLVKALTFDISGSKFIANFQQVIASFVCFHTPVLFTCMAVLLATAHLMTLLLSLLLTSASAEHVEAMLKVQIGCL